MSKTVAIVEDEAAIADLVARALEEHGFRTQRHTSGDAFLSALRRGAPNLCLLDLGLPDGDGIALMARIRTISPIPIIIISGRQHTSDRIVGLELGADDYVTKPFDPREVVARVRSVLRRAETDTPSAQGTASVARFAGWRFDAGALELTTPDGASIDLTAAEARLLLVFLESPQRVLNRDFLLTRAGGEDSFDRSIDVRMSRLRKKLQAGGDKPVIRTVYGAGYLLTCAVDWSAH